MIQIGNAFVSEDAIEAVFPAQPEFAGNAEVVICINLRSGLQLTTEASYLEVMAALTSCGLLRVEDPAWNFSEDDRRRLINLDTCGYVWIARDADGKLYAYKCKPVRNGGYWDTAGGSGAGAGLHLKADFESIDISVDEPLHIRTVLQNRARRGTTP